MSICVSECIVCMCVYMSVLCVSSIRVCMWCVCGCVLSVCEYMRCVCVLSVCVSVWECVV